jgi:hypothetical protein
MKNTLLYTIILLLFLTSCMNDDVLRDFEKLNANENNEGVFILNEGSFMSSNASLSYYNTKTRDLINDVFYKTNALPLGDVAQSITINDSLAYVVINNSGKVYIINANTFKYVGKITGLVSPRYIQIINSEKAYISDLYSNAISVINLKTNTIYKQIISQNCASTEQMVMFENFVYVTCWSYSNKVLKINTLTDLIEDSILVTKQPNSLKIDKNGKLWVLSDGGFSGSSYGQDTSALTKIDLETFTIEKVFKFPDFDASPTKLQINANADSLYFIYNSWSVTNVLNCGIFAMSIFDENLPENAVIEQGNRIFYGLGISKNSEIYVSDAKNFSQQSTVYRYNSMFQLIDSYDVGIAANSFGFK